jgi:serine/threonine protein kinase HipA of HipAB toxin-antitoxin module
MHERASIRIADRAQRYPQLVSDIMEGGLPGSSAHGEHPKFVTYLEPEAPYAVLVKFSPPVTTRVGLRWADLLVAEHLAHEVLRGGGVATAQSRIERFSDRTYLETVRFDRAGRDGRIGVTSMSAIDAELHGKLDNWIDAAKRLYAGRHIAADTMTNIRLLATFCALIANTDRHLGNLAFYDHYDGKFALAPVYDMLPMLYAPEHDELPARTFTPVPPSADSLAVYGSARSLAEQYWGACAADDRISEDFRRTCAANLEALRSLPRSGAFSAAATTG